LEGTAARREFDVIIVGAGITGVGLYWDLLLRGFRVLLVEQAFPTAGTSGRYHGLLHSGARYAVVDPEAAQEAARENQRLRRLFPEHVHATGGYFLQLVGDGDDYVQAWVKACRTLGIPVEEVEPARVRSQEPLVSPSIRRAYLVEDGTIDAFTLTHALVETGKGLGGAIRFGSKVTALVQRAGRVEGVEVLAGPSGEKETYWAPVVVNAAGPWAALVAKEAGVRLPLLLDRGTLLVFSRRLNGMILNRLRPPGDGDIFVPHGQVTIFGTTSEIVTDPEDLRPRPAEIAYLLRLGSSLIPDLGSFRLIRAFSGIRPLYQDEKAAATLAEEGPGGAVGRQVSRGFAFLDHAQEGAAGFFSLVGGKLTTFRLMAEVAGNVVAAQLGAPRPSRTATHSLREVQEEVRVRRTLPKKEAAKAEATQRSPSSTPGLVKAAEAGPDETPRVHGGVGLPHAEAPVLLRRELTGKPLVPDDEMVCECEGVTWAQVREAFLAGARDLESLRRVTRLGLGPCQGTRCSLRAIGFLVEEGLLATPEAMNRLETFWAERWRGQEAVAWGAQLRQMELFRGLYQGLLGWWPGLEGTPGAGRGRG